MKIYLFYKDCGIEADNSLAQPLQIYFTLLLCSLSLYFVKDNIGIGAGNLATPSIISTTV